MGNHIIELNGQRYNALNGRLLPPVDPATPAKPAAKSRSVKHISGRAIDIVAAPAPTKPQPAAKHHQPTPVVPAKPGKPSIGHPVTKRPAHSTIHTINLARQPQPAKTLMRTSVTKPKPAARRQPHVQTRAGSLPTRIITDVPSPQSSLTERRLVHAHATARSPHISRFAMATKPAMFKKFQPLAVHAAPQPIASPPKAARTKNGAPLHISDMLTRAVAQAASHQQPISSAKKSAAPHRRSAAKSRQSRRPWSLAAGSLIVAILAVAIYYNLPNINLHLAAMHAGISAELPADQPAGYSLSNTIQYGTGHVTMTFRSTSSNRYFQLAEQASNWDNQALQTAFLTGVSRNYQTINDRGRTLYIYHNGNAATWVSDGIWYQITGNANLNRDQLLNLAASL